MTPIYFVLVGLAMITVGICAWFGWYRSWARGPLGNMYVPLAPMGVGVILVGLAGAWHTLAFGFLWIGSWIGFFGIFLGLAGVLLYVLSPAWLEPLWYREFKQSGHQRLR